MAASYVMAMLHENAVDAALSFAGPGWVNTATMKLANVATDPMSEIARSVSVDPEDTQFVVDLGRAQTIGGAALGNTNVQPTAKWRISAFQDEALTIQLYTSGLIGIPGGVVPSLSLAWEDPGFWNGLTQEFDDLVKGVSLIHLTPSNVYARYWKFELVDPTNPASFLNVGRAYLGKRLALHHNFSHGSVLSFEDLTDTEESRNGTKFFNDRNIRRIFNFAFEYLPEAEAVAQIYRLAMRSRRSKQIVLVPFPDRPETYQRDAFFGTLRQVPSILRNAFQRINTDFVVEESL